MKTTIELKSIYGSILFSYEKEDNTIKETVEKYLNENIGKIISNLDLSNLDLSKISFYNSRFDNSSFDNSRFENICFDNSRFYNSRFYNSSFYNSRFYNSRFDNSRFDNSRFDNSSFYNSSFDNSRFYNSRYNNIKIKKITFISGLYKYLVVGVLSEDDKKYIGLGCYFRSIEDWKNDFWNNDNEFPDDGSEKSNLRIFAFETIKSGLK